MIQFIRLEKELENYKNDFISLYNSKMGSTRHTLEISIENPSEGIYNVKIVGPEEVKYIESGRGPGKFPPVNSIRDWVERKLGVTELPRANQLAFLIGRKISIYGTEGNHLIEECVSELNATYEAKLQKALDDDILEYIESADVRVFDALSGVF